MFVVDENGGTGAVLPEHASLVGKAQQVKLFVTRPDGSGDWQHASDLRPMELTDMAMVRSQENGY